MSGPLAVRRRATDPTVAVPGTGANSRAAQPPCATTAPAGAYDAPVATGTQSNPTGDLSLVPGVPESTVSHALAASLPEPEPAPWTTSGSGLLWLHAASHAAASHHQRGLTYQRSLPVTVGAFLRYDRGPVGAYDEVLGVPAAVIRRNRLSLPVSFMAVDSERSIAGGRANWGLPKTLAQFEWQADAGSPRRLVATGQGWRVSARVGSAGPRVPLWMRTALTQVDAHGTIVTVPIRSTGVGRLARITVDCQGPSLPHWLRSGTHLGAVVERATHTILPAIPDPPA